MASREAFRRAFGLGYWTIGTISAIAFLRRYTIVCLTSLTAGLNFTLGWFGGQGAAPEARTDYRTAPETQPADDPIDQADGVAPSGAQGADPAGDRDESGPRGGFRPDDHVAREHAGRRFG